MKWSAVEHFQNSNKNSKRHLHRRKRERVLKTFILLSKMRAAIELKSTHQNCKKEKIWPKYVRLGNSFKYLVKTITMTLKN